MVTTSGALIWHGVFKPLPFVVAPFDILTPLDKSLNKEEIGNYSASRENNPDDYWFNVQYQHTKQIAQKL